MLEYCTLLTLGSNLSKSKPRCEEEEDYFPWWPN